MVYSFPHLVSVVVIRSSSWEYELTGSHRHVPLYARPETVPFPVISDPWVERAAVNSTTVLQFPFRSPNAEFS
jgi:hypothetical protein